MHCFHWLEIFSNDNKWSYVKISLGLPLYLRKRQLKTANSNCPGHDWKKKTLKIKYLFETDLFISWFGNCVCVDLNAAHIMRKTVNELRDYVLLLLYLQKSRICKH